MIYTYSISVIQISYVDTVPHFQAGQLSGVVEKLGPELVTKLRILWKAKVH